MKKTAAVLASVMLVGGGASTVVEGADPPSIAQKLVQFWCAATGWTCTPVIPPPAPTPPPPSTPNASPTVKPKAKTSSSAARTFKATISAYTWYSNTPPSKDIAHPKSLRTGGLHEKAGGVGIYADPITIAVGHVIKDGVSKPDYPIGTRFYIPYLKRYFVAEDVCGDGNNPQAGPCHTNRLVPGQPWLDIWVDGDGKGADAARRCAEGTTNLEGADVIQNPGRKLPVTPGPLC